MADQNYMLDSANMRGVDLSIELAGIKLANPVIAASGTFGYGEEFERFANLRQIGGICVKGTSARPIDGNLPPRLFPTASGMLNLISVTGLKGFGKFCSRAYPAGADEDPSRSPRPAIAVDAPPEEETSGPPVCFTK